MVLLTTSADGNLVKHSMHKRIYFFVPQRPPKSRFSSSFANDNVGSVVVWSVPSKTLRFLPALMHWLHDFP